VLLLFGGCGGGGGGGLGVNGPMPRADNLTNFTCRLSSDLGVSVSRKPQDRSRPAQGFLYLLSAAIKP